MNHALCTNECQAESAAHPDVDNDDDDDDHALATLASGSIISPKMGQHRVLWVKVGAMTSESFHFPVYPCPACDTRPHTHKAPRVFVEQGVSVPLWRVNSTFCAVCPNRPPRITSCGRATHDDDAEDDGAMRVPTTTT